MAVKPRDRFLVSASLLPSDLMSLNDPQHEDDRLRVSSHQGQNGTEVRRTSVGFAPPDTALFGRVANWMFTHCLHGGSRRVV
jgi:hypothetical protein